jgi:hypothetical protein
VNRALPALAIVLLGVLLHASSASAAFGFKEVGFLPKGPDGSPSLQAGSHPFATELRLEMNTLVDKEGLEFPDGAIEDLTIDLPEGFVGDAIGAPRCPASDFAEFSASLPACSNSAVVGISSVKFEFVPFPAEGAEFFNVPIYNLIPPPGVVARFGFIVLNVPVTVDAVLNPDPPYNARLRIAKTAQSALFYGARSVVWGDPSSSLHDEVRGDCLEVELPSPPEEPARKAGKECPVEEGQAFTTLPRSCTGPLETRFSAVSWPGWELLGGEPAPTPRRRAVATALTEPGMVNCPKLGFGPRLSVAPTSDRADAPSGLEARLRIEDEGLANPAEGATALSDIKRARVTLPEGMTINPSQAEGLDVCSEDELERERPDSRPGEGCPQASKIGTVEVESPLAGEEVLRGALFVAEPYENPFGSLLAVYMTIKSAKLGIAVRLAGKVEPDRRSGQIVTTFGDPSAKDPDFRELPQLPFSEFRLRFREGGRSPLVTPPGCGSFETKAVFTPWANPGRTHPETSTFEIDRGVGGGPCPSGAQPFEPGFAAGTLSNHAGSHSPFAMRLTRRDGDQDLTRFDAVLPPGVLAKLAGVPWCPDAAIAQAKAKSGKQELAAPSCPLASQIGAVQGGAGAGEQLTYVPGRVYLAGPVGGAPISVVGVVPAVAGPFDVGTIVVRQALRVDPVSGEVTVDGAVSDPIPHILAGIPLRVRDIQVNVNRPNFTLNPTSCRPMATLAGIWGGGSALFSSADDAPVLRSARFQAAGCRGLGFKPRLGIRLRGSTKRGGHPALRAAYVPQPGHANLRRLALAFPRSAFVENANFRTICTRVQYAVNACPKGSIYGRAKAWTPLLSEPLQGPVYLRSSDNLLPDAVFALKGLIDIEVAVRIDSVKGRLRATVTEAPDAPVSRVVVQMQGGRKGLFVNSRNICRGANRGSVKLIAQSNRRATLKPRFRARGCGKKGGRRKGRGRGLAR